MDEDWVYHTAERTTKGHISARRKLNPEEKTGMQEIIIRKEIGKYIIKLKYKKVIKVNFNMGTYLTTGWNWNTKQENIEAEKREVNAFLVSAIL